MKLPIQMWLGSYPSPDLLHKISNPTEWHKPKGGLWTSTIQDGTSEWWDWCNGEEFGDYESVWALEPVEARIAIIKDPNDLIAFQKKYARPEPEWMKKLPALGLKLGYLIDYEKASEEYDAIWIPNPHPHRLNMDTLWFNTMDVESTLWFRWMFERVEKLSLPSPRRVCKSLDISHKGQKAVCNLTLGHEGSHEAGFFRNKFSWSDSVTRHTKRSDGRATKI